MKNYINIRRIFLIILINIFLFSTVSFAAENKGKPTDTKATVIQPKYLDNAIDFYNFFKENYPFLDLSKKEYGYDFIGNKYNIITTLATSKTDDDFDLAMERIILSNPLSTHTLPDNLIYYLPKDFNFIYLNGEYVIVNSSNPDIKIGDTVIKINNKYIDDYVNNSDNVWKRFDLWKNKIVMKTGLFLSDKMLIITIKDKNGKENNFTVQMDKKSIYASIPSDIMTTKIIEQGNLAYMKIPNFSYLNKQTLDDFINRIKNYKSLIIDVRGNGGGDPNYVKLLMSKLISKPSTITNYLCIKNTKYITDKLNNSMLSENPVVKIYNDYKILTDKEINTLSILPAEVKNKDYKVLRVKLNFTPDANNFKGKVYVLTDSGCFSATEMFCNSIKRLGAAELVGDYTGGDGILLIPDDLDDLIYPFGLRYSWVIGIQDDGTINQISHTAPDYRVVESKEDLINSILKNDNSFTYDTVYKECLKIINNR